MYVFEYPLMVTHKGAFSNGITTMQRMYAPVFATHSEGVRVKVDLKYWFKVLDLLRWRALQMQIMLLKH